MHSCNLLVDNSGGFSASTRKFFSTAFFWIEIFPAVLHLFVSFFSLTESPVSDSRSPGTEPVICIGKSCEVDVRRAVLSLGPLR